MTVASDNSFPISRELLIDPNDIVIGEMIGEGDYSVVYSGLFKNRVPVAVKIVEPSKVVAVSTEQTQTFQKEVLLLSKIKHENILKFIGACIEPKLMIVTELLEGGTLQKFMWDFRPNTLDLMISLNFALQISRAMELLHSNDIIHRDLNPRNILVTCDMTQVKLAGFKIAREKRTGYMTNDTGSYRWMAPEVFTGGSGEKTHYDHKVDVYSFALMLWELVTNQTPFTGEDDIFVPYLVSQNERPSLSNIPTEMVYLLKSCWAMDPNARPEFKEITIILQNLLRSLCYSSYGAITSSEEANLNIIEESESNHVQETNCEEIRPREKEKKKKVVKMILPFFQMLRACVCMHA